MTDLQAAIKTLNRNVEVRRIIAAAQSPIAANGHMLILDDDCQAFLVVLAAAEEVVALRQQAESAAQPMTITATFECEYAPGDILSEETSHD